LKSSVFSDIPLCSPVKVGLLGLPLQPRRRNRHVPPEHVSWLSPEYTALYPRI
jgi:hypothetical protein